MAQANTIMGETMMLFVSTGSTSGGTKQAIALVQSCELDITLATKESSSKDSPAGFTEDIAGRLSFTMSSDQATTIDVGINSYDALEVLMLKRQPIWVTWAMNVTGSANSWAVNAAKKTYQGLAYITNLKLSAKNEDLSTFSISLKGTGQLKQI
jgi:TP901-1 family phage major tail protein